MTGQKDSDGLTEELFDAAVRAVYGELRGRLQEIAVEITTPDGVHVPERRKELIATIEGLWSEFSDALDLVWEPLHEGD